MGASRALAALLVVVLAQGAAKGWRSITSPAGFAVDYPQTWFASQPEPATGNISIANFPPGTGAEGVVIGNDEATISIFGAATTVKSPRDFSRQQTQWNTNVVIKNVQLHPAYAGGCAEAIESDSVNEVGPGAFQRVTAYYCEIKGTPIAVKLTNWRDDPHVAVYRKILLRVAETLRPSLGR